MAKKTKKPDITTVIAEGTLITGNLNFGGGLHLDGRVEGNVIGDEGRNATLVISDRGSVQGEVHVENLLLDGSIVGDVYVTASAELAPKARVNGNLHYHMLEMAMGAEVNGKLVKLGESGQPALLENNND